MGQGFLVKTLRNTLKHRIAYASARVVEKKSIASSLVLLKLKLLTRLPESGPPQFVMVWVPGYEAVPMSIAYHRGGELWIIVKPVGETTRSLVAIEPGGFLGVYGPLGRPLLPGDGRLLFLAGGSGIAPVINYITTMNCSRDKCLTIVGFWSKREAGVVKEFLEELGSRTLVACMDSGCDVYGTPVDALESIIIDEYDYIVSCGPPDMLKALAKKISAPRRHIIVMEAIVKCGLGLCGSCLVPGTKYFLCIDGPGFYVEELGGWVNG